MVARALAVLLVAAAALAQVDGDPVVAAVCARAGENAGELRNAWQSVPDGDRAALRFLFEHLPAADAQTLTSAFLLEDVQLAGEARRQVPWGKALPDDLFLGFVVPYALADEPREPWRRDLAARFLPRVRDCANAGAAALRLNSLVFAELGVHYATSRQRALQAPSESIAQGKATCTGLSILLAAACRACCVPARLVSVQWPHKNGNHTWVEVFDGAAWRFVGADEPDPMGFDRAWFVGDAATAAAAADPAQRPWAVSFAATGARFRPGWGTAGDLHGIDVAARYAARQEPASAGATAVADEALRQQIARFFAADAAAQATFEFDRNLDTELQTPAGDARLRALAFAAFRAAPHAELRADFAQNRVRTADRESPYTVATVGERPGNGWPLVVAMHGGGGVEKEVNDQQWQHMQVYYRPHPETGGYLYVALRAPNDTWNGFYDDAFYPLFERLVRQFVVCGDVDPDRVIAIGYSHGGYGAFALGPKLPHRFAAVHASAAAPTDGDSSPVGLHTLRFSFLVGGRDTAYGRRERCEAFGKALLALRQANPTQYATAFGVIEGNGHTGLPDRDLLPQLLPTRRQALPRDLFWEPTDGVCCDHYWLHVEAPQRGQRLFATLRGQQLTVTRRGVGAVQVLLDARLVDPKQPLEVAVGDERSSVSLTPSLRTLCATLQQRGDPTLAASCVVTLP